MGENFLQLVPNVPSRRCQHPRHSCPSPSSAPTHMLAIMALLHREAGYSCGQRTEAGRGATFAVDQLDERVDAFCLDFRIG